MCICDVKHRTWIFVLEQCDRFGRTHTQKQHTPNRVVFFSFSLLICSIKRNNTRKWVNDWNRTGQINWKTIRSCYTISQSEIHMCVCARGIPHNYMIKSSLQMHFNATKTLNCCFCVFFFHSSLSLPNSCSHTTGVSCANWLHINGEKQIKNCIETLESAGPKRSVEI